MLSRRTEKENLEQDNYTDEASREARVEGSEPNHLGRKGRFDSAVRERSGEATSEEQDG